MTTLKNKLKLIYKVAQLLSPDTDPGPLPPEVLKQESNKSDAAKFSPTQSPTETAKKQVAPVVHKSILPEVEQMQKDMLALAQTLRSSDKPSTAIKNFITKQSSESVITNLFEIIKVDGKWGPKTNQYLVDVGNFIKLLNSTYTTLNIPNNIYTDANADDFITTVDECKIVNNHIQLSTQDQIEKASFLSKHIQGIIRSFNNLKTQISHAGLVPVLEGNQPLDSYTEAKETLTPQEQEFIKQNELEKVNGVGILNPQTKLNGLLLLKDLTSKENFEKALQEAGYTNEQIQSGKAAEILQSLQQQIMLLGRE